MKAISKIKEHPFLSEYPINIDTKIVVGKKGVGKTKDTMDELLACIELSEEPVKVLVFDVNDEFEFLSEISLKDIDGWAYLEWREGKMMPNFVEGAAMRRVRMIHENGKRMNIDKIKETLGFVLDKFMGGILWIEDICKYVSDANSRDIIGSLAVSKTRRQKVIMHMQSIGSLCNPKIIGNASVVRLYKTFDSVNRYKEKLGCRYDILRIAEIIIDKKCRGIHMGNAFLVEPNPSFCLSCNLESEKIVGDFTDEDAMWAIRAFVVENNHLVGQILSQRNEDGSRVYHSEADAFKAACLSMEHYFNFKKEEQ